MPSTFLYGLDDSDIPEEFLNELVRAETYEYGADVATLLNALLLAGWVPPSRASLSSLPST